MALGSILTRWNKEDKMLTEKQKQDLLELLWYYLQEPIDSDELRLTGNGAKTQAGLIASIESVLDQNR